MDSEHSMIRQLYANSPRRQYLSENDKYIFAKKKPILRFCVIGTGVNGQEHIRNTLYEGRASIKGIFDLNKKSMEAALKEYNEVNLDRELKIYSSIHDACSDPDVDGIIISTPNFTHIDMIREVTKYQKPILLEKPMATTVSDAWEIVKIAENHKAVFQIGLQYRYKSIYVESIYEVLERKTIGDIKTISILEHRVPFFDKVKQWNKFSKYSGGTLVEKCCHYFDLFNYFAQSKPLTVYASGSMAVNFKEFKYNDTESDIIDNAMVVVEYENGIHANFNLCMFAPMFYEEIVLCGDGGRLWASEKQDFLSNDGIQSSLEINCNGYKPARAMVPKYPAAIEALGHNGATFFEHVNFVDNILGLPTNTATVQEGFWSVVVGAAARESIIRKEIINIGEFLKQQEVDPNS